jgi:hypothetical protein
MFWGYNDRTVNLSGSPKQYTEDGKQRFANLEMLQDMLTGADCCFVNLGQSLVSRPLFRDCNLFVTELPSSPRQRVFRLAHLAEHSATLGFKTTFGVDEASWY